MRWFARARGQSFERSQKAMQKAGVRCGISEEGESGGDPVSWCSVSMGAN